MKAVLVGSVSGCVLRVILVVLCTQLYSVNAQLLPGGVFGAEVWYIASDTEISENIFTDHSQFPLLIERCTNDEITSGLLNFDPAIFSESLCLSYRAPLEELHNKSIFIVAEPLKEDSFPLFSSNLGVSNFYEPPADTYSENTFIIETEKGYLTKASPLFEPYQNAHVYFYDWNNFDQEKKYKSYGQKGEATYNIGNPLYIPEIFEDPGHFFAGLLPEFITFNRKLSRDEYERVESYLALKYGITKWHTDAYKSSQHKVFWKAENNLLFSHNIFGIGRDDVSGLNQLQCESAHRKGYLIAAVEQIRPTNEMVQAETSIANEEFLVFGDNGRMGLTTMNSRNFQRFNRVWLAQITGEDIRKKTIHFKLRIDGEFDRATFEKIVQEELFVWMLHDLRANSEEVSDFEAAHIRQYPSSGITQDPDTGDYYVEFEFENLFFDTDRSRFDQFTFALGSECSVTFEPFYDCEQAAEGLSCYKLQVIAVGHCSKIFLYDSTRNEIQLSLDPELTDNNGFPTYIAEVCAPERYLVEIHLPDGSVETIYYETTNIGPYRVELGDDVQYLSTEQPEILLDAGAYMPVGSSYVWFKDNVFLDYFEPQLLVGEIGKYCVEVTSPDGLCSFKECVLVESYFKVEHICQIDLCNPMGNSIVLNFHEGLPQFEIELQSSEGSVFYYTNEETFIISNLATGFYFIKVTDAAGRIFEDFCQFEAGSTTDMLLGPDLILSSSRPEHQIDASILVSNPEEALFRWFRDGLLLSHDASVITINEPGFYRVEAVEGDCVISGIQTVRVTFEGEILGTNACDDDDENEVQILISFGIGPFNTEIHGIRGTSYSRFIPDHGGSIIFTLPRGSYGITTSDNYGNVLQRDQIFEGFILQSIESQIQNYCDAHLCEYQEFCETPFYDFSGTSLHQIDLEAVLPTNSDDFYVSWYLDGAFVSADTQINLVRDGCEGISKGCEVLSITLEVTDKECFSIETIYIDAGWCLKSEVPRGYSSKVFPNPAEADVTFNYLIESNSKESFKGKIEVFSVTGALIFSDRIHGDWKYTLTYRLISSGVYLIRTTTEEGVVKADRVIIK